VQDFEKLGAFYLGRLFDAQKAGIRDDLLLYDAKDLTTHAVCVGMTGSGKTGLCVTLLEEAAIDGIPALVIDPKGDLGNLLLTFPGLEPSDFRPWIDEGEAARKGMTPAEYAARTAKTWATGLADWGQDGARIARFRDSVETTIYTPGSSAGRPLRVLRSLAAPPRGLAGDEEGVRERLLAVSSGLLSLLGIDADPVRSREHILLSNLLHRAWSEGRDLELASLIREIQSPPFERLGVLDLESFFPARERSELATSLNNLLASPGFSVWMEGEPLEVGSLLYTVRKAWRRSSEARERAESCLRSASLPESCSRNRQAALDAAEEKRGWRRVSRTSRGSGRRTASRCARPGLRRRTPSSRRAPLQRVVRAWRRPRASPNRSSCDGPTWRTSFA
jgi:hypothetical protein